MEGEPGSIETVEIDMTALQRRLDPGDTLRFTVATTDAGFIPSRTSAGAYIRHSDENPSTVSVPAIGGEFADLGKGDAAEGDFLSS